MRHYFHFPLATFIAISFVCLIGLAAPQIIQAQTTPDQSTYTPATDLPLSSNHQIEDHQTVTLEATVTKVVKQEVAEVMGHQQLTQRLEILITSGSLKGQTIAIDHGAMATVNVQAYEVGDNVQILASTTTDGQSTYQITDYVRRTPLAWLAVIFIGLILLINMRKGLASLFSLALTFIIIFAIVLPLILAGHQPVMVALAAALIMIPLTYFIAHGFNRKTTVAAIGTLISLVISVVLAQYFIYATRLTGYASDEAGFLAANQHNGDINIHGLILAGIVLGLIGVLDDVTITQAGFIQQLKQAHPKISSKELYQRAMAVGRDHIASLVNTLVLVYTSAAMPLLLLFTQTGRPFMEIINYEIVAEELVRTLVVSIGIVISVPVTTYISAKTIDWPIWQKPIFNRFSGKEDHAHHH